MKAKTSELEGAALDWAVAKAVGVRNPRIGDNGTLQKQPRIFCTAGGGMGTMPYEMEYRPSFDWSLGGPLVESYMVTVEADAGMKEPWEATLRQRAWGYGTGPTALIAAMRAIVASGLGDEVDIPEELI